jgi:hypothetical protein
MPSAFQGFRFHGSKVPVEFDVKDSKTRNKKSGIMDIRCSS